MSLKELRSGSISMPGMRVRILHTRIVHNIGVNIHSIYICIIQCLHEYRIDKYTYIQSISTHVCIPHQKGMKPMFRSLALSCSAQLLVFSHRYKSNFRASGSPSPLWYSFETGPAHVINLCSYIDTGYNSPMGRYGVLVCGAKLLFQAGAFTPYCM